jgi:hypothetical protein
MDDLIHAYLLQTASYAIIVLLSFPLVYVFAREGLQAREGLKTKVLAPIGILIAAPLAALLVPFTLSAVVEVSGPLPGTPFDHDWKVTGIIALVAAACSAFTIFGTRLVMSLASSGGAGSDYSNEFYAAALQEVETGSQDKALWARAIADCDGNRDRATSIYVRQRAALLRPTKQPRTRGTLPALAALIVLFAVSIVAIGFVVHPILKGDYLYPVYLVVGLAIAFDQLYIRLR